MKALRSPIPSVLFYMGVLSSIAKSDVTTASTKTIEEKELTGNTETRILLDEDEDIRFQGDIMLSSNKNVNVTEKHRGLATLPIVEDLWHNDFRKGYFFITVRIDNSYSKNTQDLIVKALRNLQWRSQVIRFDIIYSQPNPPIPYLHYVNGNDGCWSWIGKNPNQAYKPEGQIIMLQDGKCSSIRSIQHEMLHALGFAHEQSRPDRDQYVNILWENVIPGREKEFDLDDVENVNSLGTEYDLDSIMHYPANAWSKNGLATIEPKGGAKIGTRTHASWTDILQIRLMYQCKSGPRDLKSYEANKCTEDCQCWHNEPGCGNDDSLCTDDMECSDNVCVLPVGNPNAKKLLMKDIYGSNYYFVSGVMFDIQAKENPITITNLFYQGLGGSARVDIYSKEWSHFRWSSTPNRWQKIGSAYLEMKPSDLSVLFPEDTFKPIFVDKWNRRGFYIQVTDCSIDCNKLRVWLGSNYAESQKPFVEDENVRILEGCALKGSFDNSGQRCRNERGGESFTFWGGVRYTL